MAHKKNNLTQQALSLLPMSRDRRVLRVLQDNLRQSWADAKL